MPVTAQKNRTERLNLRVTGDQARLIRLAAKETSANVSSFIVESACLRAEMSLASQRHLVYTEDQWAAFVAALDQPAKAKPRLKKLLAEPSILERPASERRKRA
jgi:uncharacterized protein (DUF1778 family)